MNAKPYLFVLILCALASQALIAQTSQVVFGKNRVQYHDDFDQWLSYESQNFVTYWYGKSKFIGHTAIQMAEKDYAEVVALLEYRINDKIEILVYQDLTDMKQSNIGGEEAFINQTGQPKISGNKLFVYFNGDHNQLRQQIREGIAKVFLNSMLYGSNLQEVVQNTVVSNLPDWFAQGLIAFVGADWDVDTDNEWRDLVLTRKYKNFTRAANENPRIAGHAFWYYIALNYGKTEINNLLYLTRINRSMESGFQYVLGSTYQKVTQNLWSYYQKQYQEEQVMLDSISPKKAYKAKNRKRANFTQVRFQPGGDAIAYVSNDVGQSKVYLQEKGSKRKRILKTGYRNIIQSTDYTMPIITWSPKGLQLALIYEKRDVWYLDVYDYQTKKRSKSKLAPRFERVFTADFINEDTLAFSAMVNGFSDLFTYRLKTRQSESLTEDIYDDLDVRSGIWNGVPGVVFSSNRPATGNEKVNLDTMPPVGTFDLYFMPMDPKPGALQRLTNTQGANERQALFAGDNGILYLSDEYGIWNRKRLANGDNQGQTTYLTNQSRNLEGMDYDPQSKELMDILKYKNRSYMFLSILDTTPREVIESRFSRFRRSISPIVPKVIAKDPVTAIPPVQDPFSQKQNSKIEEEVIADGYLFQTEFQIPLSAAPKINAVDPVDILKPELVPNLQTANDSAFKARYANPMRINPLRVVPYRLKVRLDDFSTTLDNAPLFGGLDNFAGLTNNNYSQPVGILMKATMKDLFEDIEVEGGVRVPINFKGAEYFLTLKDKKHRFDKQYSLYRRSLKQEYESALGNPGRARLITIMGLAELRYPFDVYGSVRLAGFLRQDKFNPLSTDRAALEDPGFLQQRMGLRLEYIFDNSVDIDLNMRSGTRFKVFGTYAKPFTLQFGNQTKFSFNEGYVASVGTDLRHYYRLDRLSILAGRFAMESSFGPEKNLYLLGGTDQWIFPAFTDNIPFPTNTRFAFQSTAPNIRGFNYNIRNGSTYALANLELRIPLFKYLYKRPIKNSFIRSFQLVSFFDFGTAWVGKGPFDDENPLNIIFLENPTVKVKVRYFRDPIVAGMGFGARALLFGYYLRLDYGWGLETRKIQSPIVHLSMGTDF